MRLKGLAGVVTGSSSGIGRSIALRLASEGAAVVVNARGSRADGVSAIERVVEEIRAAGGQAIGMAGAVDDPEFATQLINGCVDSFGKIDILVNNAGIYSEEAIGSVEGCSIGEWQRIMSVNLNAVFYTVRAAIPHMKRQRFGRVINASSFAGTGRMGGSAYCASKAGLFGLGRALAVDYGPYGITVNTYNPEAQTSMGDVQNPDALSDMIDHWLDRGFRTKAEADYLAGLNGPDGVAPWIAYLCTDEAAYLNGHVFAVEGRRVALLGAPDEDRTLVRDYVSMGPWSMDELIHLAPLAFPLENQWPRRNDEMLERWDTERIATQ